MMKRSYILILILTCLAVTPAATQERSIERKLSWGEPIMNPDSEPGRYQRLLWFDRAVHDETYFSLPYYPELLPWENAGQEAIVRVEDAIYQELGQDETSGVDFPTRLPSEPRLEYRIRTLRKQKMLDVHLYPFRRNPLTGRPEKLVKYRMVISTGGREPFAGTQKKRLSYATRSQLASGKWYRMKVSEDGIYQITYSRLQELGFGNPANVRIFGMGGAMLPYYNNGEKPDDLLENAVWMEKGGDGVFNQGDYLLFYGKGPGIWYYDTLKQEFIHSPHLYAKHAFYFITEGSSPGPQIATIPSSTLTPTRLVETFHDYLVHESDQQNLLRSGRRWFEPMVPYNPRNIPFSFPELANNQPVRVSTLVVGRSPVNTSFSVSLNGNIMYSLPVSSVNTGSYVSDFAREAEGSGTMMVSGDELTVTLQYNQQGVPSSECWIDWVRVNAVRNLRMEGNSMHFRNTESAGQDEVSGFRLAGASPDIRVWDIRQPSAPLNINGSFVSNRFDFTLETPEIREFIAFTPSGFLQPEFEASPLPNQDLHGEGPFDMVIVSHPDFLNQAEELASHRSGHDGLRIKLVTPEQIYNEFSSGMPDVSALRNYMKMLYDRASVPEDIPRYLLLFGDGSYDNLSEDDNNTNFILTYQSLNSFSPTRSYVTDDFFGLLDDDEGEADGLVDLGIGRLPVSSTEEAGAVVKKIVGYDDLTSAGDWKNTICFIGDDEDYNIHMRDADILATYIDTTFPAFSLNKIYLDAFNQVSTPNGQRYPNVNEAINRQMDKGAIIVNYTGHGNERGLAHESILGKNDIQSWDNAGRLPLFITATCEFSRFDDIDRSLTGEFSRKTSAGELVLLNPFGGGAALLTTTRLVYSSPNFILNRNFYQYVFNRDAEGNYYRLGDVLRWTKNISGSSINKRNFTLLGDPSMTLTFPEYQVVTEQINSVPAGAFSDTLKALSKVTINGYIADFSGNRLSQFNGVLFPAVFDKRRQVSTLDNDGFGPMDFTVRNNLLYRGKASVESGEFSFSFIVPKDIAYQVGYGKISYFAAGTAEEAGGAFTNALVGGYSASAAGDTEGPGIRLFMNDENFVAGGITDENPLLLALVSDSSGINTVGNGIGHDITAELDGDNRNLIVLNDYYESELDSYQEGRISYRLSDLEPGEHLLKLKVWDVHNNSSASELDFVVAADARLALDHVLNYPNPFTTRTAFFFEHNQPGNQLDIQIQIFTVSGKLIKTLSTSLFAEGYRVGPIDWDGLDEYGNNIGRGVYVYRVRVRTSGGQAAGKFEKLVILR